MDFSHKNIKEIKSAKSHKDKGFITMEIITNDDENVIFIAEYGKFCEWLKENKDSYNNLFEDFVNEFFEKSTENSEELSEVIDKYGNIFPDDDKPSNATNKEIGSSVFDLDKAIQQGIPKSYKNYSGYYGTGSIVW